MSGAQSPLMLADQQRMLRMAARALSRAGLVHAFGHCSFRENDDYFWVCPAMPMGCIPAGAENQRVPVRGPLPEGVLGEVRIHQNLYASRPEVNAVGRIMPPAIMALSTQGLTPRCRHGLSAYFGNDIPLWRDPRLLRNDEAAKALVELMAKRPALVMRGNGAVIAAASLEEMLSYAWFLEDTARLELQVRAANFAPEQGCLDQDEIRDRHVTTGNVFGRMWQYLTLEDPEYVA
ncbi:decarboxyl [gamma proteobacterium BDW918]|jgi:HCOMODA/2-hydroxy-3-carboxy-muconic semialdehyde decarboxylase|uniref:Aldolase n=1 Tax=Zhongshania aliphaticivorans TaxID=1470434 RepID=A0A127M2P0_9GAMM|nr:class II aldolase/adducin family protein [Zhongshania aliphaticivorans]AMO67486.1 aldolase [Zhongshania aliphaticivorans]EIF45110.1 decarboxyl [gamma proteobacterium BDW918]